MLSQGSDRRLYRPATAPVLIHSPTHPGRQINVMAHKGLMAIFSYILKEDKNQEIWGGYTKETIEEMARARDCHTKFKAGDRQREDSQLIISKLTSLNEWEDAYDDPGKDLKVSLWNEGNV